MDRAVLDDDNYNELYRVHTGHALFGSGSDSDSFDEPILIDNKPPLYTFEELNANLVVIGATSNQNKNDLNKSHTGGSSALKTDKIVQQELKKLILHDTCLLCNVYKCPNHDFENHKKGKTHRKKVEQYIKERMVTSQNKKYAANSYCNGNIQNKQALDLTKHDRENLLQKLSDLIHRTYCYVCDANLSSPVNADSHYNSWRHTNNVRYWKGEFTTGSQKKPAYHNVKPNYCFICKAKLPGGEQVQSHLKSNGHRTNVEMWINEQNLKLQLKNKNSVKTINTNQNITKTSTTVQKAESICKVCGIKVGADLETHSLIDEHKRNVEAFCFVCDIKTMSKQQLAEHVRGQRHKTNLSMKKFSSSLDIPRSIITPVRKEDTSNIGKIMVQSNKSQIGVIEKSTTDNQTPVLTINSADKNKNKNSSQDIPNETYKEIKAAETIIDKNKTRIVSPEFYNYTLMVDKTLVHSNKSQLGVIEKNTIGNETPALTTNSADKTENRNSSKDISNDTYKEIKPAETTIDKNKTSSVSQEFDYSDPSTSKGMNSEESSIINSSHKNENINMAHYVADKVDEEIKSENRIFEENKVSEEFNESNISTKTNSKYCQTEEMEEIRNKSGSGELHREMEKFACALNSVPLDIALRYLQNCTKKLEESMNNGNVLDIEVENRTENDVRLNSKRKRKKKSVFKPFFRLNTGVSEVNIGQSEDLSNVPKSKTNNVVQFEDLSKEVPKSKTNNLLSKGVTCPCALM